MSETQATPNAGDASRVSTVTRTRGASKPDTNVRPTRHADAAIVASAVEVLRAHPTMGWVETLRTMRWTPTLAACDYARFTSKGKYASVSPSLWAQAQAIASKPVRKPRAKRGAK